MNIVEIIMHRAGMENPQVIITFPVTVRTFHRQSPNLLSLSAIGVLADVVGLSYFIVICCLTWKIIKGAAIII
jgi:hypothetical protein